MTMGAINGNLGVVGGSIVTPGGSFIEVDEQYPGNGWTAGSDNEENPTGWRKHVGNGGGGRGPTRLIPGGAKYVDVRCYWDTTGGDRWVGIIFNAAGSGQFYDGIGYGVLVRPDGGLNMAWKGSGTYTLGVADGNDIGTRNTPEQAATIGLYVPGDGSVEVYVEGTLLQRVEGYTPNSSGSLLMVGSYNGAAIHFDRVRFAASPAAAA